MKRNWLTVIIFAVSLMGAAAISQAEETKTLYGYVISVGTDEIKLNEYNENLTENEVIVKINADTKFENVANAQELSEFDDVDVQYIENEGTKVASSVKKEMTEDTAISDEPTQGTTDSASVETPAAPVETPAAPETPATPETPVAE